MNWKAEEYARDYGFVHRYGEKVLELLELPPGASVIDLGCGNGALTEQLALRGWRALGIDASETMLKEARRLHPSLTFQRDDACCFEVEEPVDAVFSNAVFHWIEEEKHPRLLRQINRALRHQGQLVCEFGGAGNGKALHDALRREWERRGRQYRLPFYFPTIGEYAPLLEQAGFRVEYASLFPRPTRCENGEAGLRRWVKMFVREPFQQLGEQEGESILHAVEEELRPRLFREGSWYIDYVRIRWKAVKVREA